MLHMPKEYLSRSLQKKSYRDEDLSYSRFFETDLRGVDFSGADLSGASFVNVKTGVTPINTFVILFAALLVSALSGYIAMLAGATIQTMLVSEDWKIKISGITTIVIGLFLIV